ncbi:phenylacetic acid degradation protein PaaN [Pseudomonas lactis]|uniref:Phenylacetic acid degradation protein PaaN n=1 Tax=Pseudomonas lactis TaxID=1615674 RepID=A0A7Y1M751_9PSED|nr:phenylacetic acid degradation protein PaaN [Pseudomonas lactis]NNA76461.1 phenylacetic acid degradation protein PaaN [Pseudomonas lactis]
MNLFNKHNRTLKFACKTILTRESWSAFADSPANHPQGTERQIKAEADFTALLGRYFEIDQPGTIGQLGSEISPYTLEPLGVQYPHADLDCLFVSATESLPAWRDASIETRIGVLIEALERLYENVFLIAKAAQHTTGQSLAMSYAGSGVNALDRGLEAIAQAWIAMRQVPPTALWTRQFGKQTISLNKSYRIIPRGVAVCFCCASFPTWNAYPSIFASLATGNPVIVKPHPGAVLPMALSVRVIRQVLAEAGFSPNLVTFALDSTETLIGKALVKHPQTAIVDFTGSVAFGAWVEANAYPAICFTETAGINSVIIDSTDDLEGMLRSLATTMCMFSAQMCTSPQNFYLPKTGIRVGRGDAIYHLSYNELTSKLCDAVSNLTQDPARCASILATIQSDATLLMLDQLEADTRQLGRVLLSHRRYTHPEYPSARTSTPLIVEVPVEHADIYAGERFGPVAFIIPCNDTQEALARACSDVKQHGGITAYVYSTDEWFIEEAEQSYATVGAQLTINLTGSMPLNFAAAYSDYHVSGLNPSGTATLTDISFVGSRFHIAQSRRPA